MAGAGARSLWLTVVPAAVTITIALVPSPDGLAPHAWYFFALFAGIVVGLMTEPLPGPAVSLIGVTLITVLAPWVLFSPDELAAAGFDATDASLAWALSGFSNSTVWLIFGAFTFALGYEKTGLGRRIALMLVRSMGRSVFTLAYAIIAADLLMAPFTPSSTARTAGTVYPVISNLPPLYGSLPNSPTRRRIGSYLMWIALSAGAITNSMFLTAMAPNLLGVELVRKTIGFQITWADWFWAFAPLGIVLLLALPWLVYVLYPPEITKGGEVSAWAADQVKALGPTSAREKILAGLVLLALLLWMFAANTINPTTTALIVVGLMLLTSVVSWDDLLLNKPAWATLVWFATLIALADGLNRTGFVTWFGQSVAGGVADMTPRLALVVLTCVYFVAHYLFASVTAHTAAILPVMLAVGASVPGLNVSTLAMMLVLSGGIMGLLTPFAGGPNPVYYGSGYLPARDFWPLGAACGFLFFAAWLVVGLWLLPIG